MSDYPNDTYGRPVHKDLDALAVEITKAAHSSGGKFPDTYEIPVERFNFLAVQNAVFNGASGKNGGSVGYDRPYMNFIWRGVAVKPMKS